MRALLLGILDWVRINVRLGSALQLEEFSPHDHSPVLPRGGIISINTTSVQWHIGVSGSEGQNTSGTNCR